MVGVHREVRPDKMPQIAETFLVGQKLGVNF